MPALVYAAIMKMKANPTGGRSAEPSMNGKGIILPLLAVFLYAACLPAQPSQRGAAAKTPEVIWEREFEENVGSVGVDVDCYLRSGGDISSCLKWIQLRGEFYRFDQKGKLLTRALTGFLPDEGFSDNGKYLSKARSAKRLWGRYVRIHTILDWNMKLLWQTDDEIWPWPIVRSNGSAVFFWGWYGEAGYVTAARFYDRRGKLRSVHSFPKRLSRVAYGVSDSMFALCTSDGTDGFEVSVFDTKGLVAWRKSLIGQHGFVPRKIDVSDECDVVLYLRSHDPQGAEVLMFNERGVLRDSMCLSDRARCGELEICGREAFFSLSAYDLNGLKAGVQLICYDLDEMKGSIVYKTDPYRTLRYLKGRTQAGLIAVCEYKLVPGQVPLVEDCLALVFSLDGELVASIPLYCPDFPPPWFSVLPGGLLVAEGSRLKLYEIK